METLAKAINSLAGLKVIPHPNPAAPNQHHVYNKALTHHWFASGKVAVQNSRHKSHKYNVLGPKLVHPTPQTT